MNFKNIKSGLSLILIFSIILFSCNKQDISNLSDTINIRNNGADMPAHIYGNASDDIFIVVLHGGPGGNGLEYRFGKYAAELEKKYAVVYWDQRGQGMSQGRYTKEDLTISHLTDDLLKLILVLKNKYGDNIKLFLLGHSWGGMLGTSFMITGDNQKHVKGWIESDGAHDIPKLNIEAVKMFRTISQEQLSLGNSTEKWTEINNWAENIDTNNITTDQGGEINSYGFEVEQTLLDDGFLNEGQSPSLTKGLFSPINSITSSITGIYTNNYLNDEVENASLTNQLYKIEKPCLFLWGKYDFVVPAQLGEDAMNKISSVNKEIVYFEHSGHSPMDNEPDKFVSVIVKFIDENK